MVPPGGGPPHIHSREEEGFYIQEGEITIQVDEKRFAAVAGTFNNHRGENPTRSPGQFANRDRRYG